MEIRFVDSPEFHGPGAESLCMVPLPIPRRSDLPNADELSQMLAYDPLTPEEQQACFRMMNYLKFKASHAIEPVERERLLTEAAAVVQVLALTCQRMIPVALKLQFARAKFLEKKLALMSDGNVGLICAIERFDYRVGVQFSSYAWPAIRNGDKSQKLRDKKWWRVSQFGEYPAEGPGDEPESKIMYVESREPLPPENCMRREYASQVPPILKRVRQRSRGLVEAYFGIGRQRQTLEEIGRDVGVSRERVRQLIDKALSKFRPVEESGQVQQPIGRGRVIPDWLLSVWVESQLERVPGKKLSGWRRAFRTSTNRIAILTRLFNCHQESQSIPISERGRLMQSLPEWILDAWNTAEDDRVSPKWVSRFNQRETIAGRRAVLVALVKAEVAIRAEVNLHRTMQKQGREERSRIIEKTAEGEVYLEMTEIPDRIQRLAQKMFSEPEAKTVRQDCA